MKRVSEGCTSGCLRSVPQGVEQWYTQECKTAVYPGVYNSGVYPRVLLRWSIPRVLIRWSIPRVLPKVVHPVVYTPPSLSHLWHTRLPPCHILRYIASLSLPEVHSLPVTPGYTSLPVTPGYTSFPVTLGRRRLPTHHPWEEGRLPTHPVYVPPYHTLYICTLPHPGYTSVPPWCAALLPR